MKGQEEPEVEIPEFLRGFKDEPKKFLGGGWNDSTEVAYKKHSIV